MAFRISTSVMYLLGTSYIVYPVSIWHYAMYCEYTSKQDKILASTEVIVKWRGEPRKYNRTW